MQLKCCTQYASKFGKLTVTTGLEKVSFHSNTKKGSTKECSNYHTITLIWHTSKVMLKILQAWFQQYVNYELPDVQAGFRKGRGTRDQIANIHWIIQKQDSFRKTSTSALLTTPKPLTVWITINCGKFFEWWEYQTTWPASWEICMQIKKWQNQTWKNRLVPNWERSSAGDQPQLIQGIRRRDGLGDYLYAN